MTCPAGLAAGHESLWSMSFKPATGDTRVASSDAITSPGISPCVCSNSSGAPFESHTIASREK